MDTARQFGAQLRATVTLCVRMPNRQPLAGDGKRIRGANRNGTLRYETATLVEHSTGVPLASLNFHDENGELAALGALLEVVPIAGALITLDALHTTRETASSIVEQHGADYLLTVKRTPAWRAAAWRRPTVRPATTSCWR